MLSKEEPAAQLRDLGSSEAGSNDNRSPSQQFIGRDLELAH